MKKHAAMIAPNAVKEFDPMDAVQIIVQSLDQYFDNNGDFLDVAARRIVADLEFHHFKIIKFEIGGAADATPAVATLT